MTPFFSQLSVFIQAFGLSLGLIVAIGAQNAFVLRQGLRREHVALVVIFCAVIDAALISAGVLGMATLLKEQDQVLLEQGLAIAGASSASLSWFVLLGIGARWLAPWFATPRAWQLFDAVIGVVMLMLAGLLFRHALYG
jgi:arginine exporter protein ArgO